MVFAWSCPTIVEAFLIDKIMGTRVWRLFSYTINILMRKLKKRTIFLLKTTCLIWRQYSSDDPKFTLYKGWDEVGAPWGRFEPSSKIFLLTIPRRCFFCGSLMLFLSCFYYAFVLVCLLMPCGHQLGKGWPLGSRLWCLILKLSLSHWYPGPGVVLDCIDSWSLPSFLLCSNYNDMPKNTTARELPCDATWFSYAYKWKL